MELQEHQQKFAEIFRPYCTKDWIYFPPLTWVNVHSAIAIKIHEKSSSVRTGKNVNKSLSNFNDMCAVIAFSMNNSSTDTTDYAHEIISHFPNIEEALRYVRNVIIHDEKENYL